ncbi:GAF domain-containing protein [Geodermatophilus sp. SYSU D01036]
MTRDEQDASATPRPRRRAAALDPSVQRLLRSVADLARRVLPDVAETSVTLVVESRPGTVASTGPPATDLDGSQYAAGAGPCLHAACEGEPAEVPDTRTERRWRAYAGCAVDHGVLSSLSVPLDLDGDGRRTGSLNVYARRPHAFDTDARRSAVRRFADLAATVVRGRPGHGGTALRETAPVADPRSLVDAGRRVRAEVVRLQARRRVLRARLAATDTRVAATLEQMALRAAARGRLAEADRLRRLAAAARADAVRTRGSASP